MEKSLLAKPEYIDTNNMVTLILRNKIANHDSTISEATMLKIENIFPKLNPTEILVVQYLFDYHQATISDFLQHIDKTEPAIRGAINKLIDLAIVSKKTDKQRDKNAIYVFKKS